MFCSDEEFKVFVAVVAGFCWLCVVAAIIFFRVAAGSKSFLAYRLERNLDFLHHHKLLLFICSGRK